MVGLRHEPGLCGAALRALKVCGNTQVCQIRTSSSCVAEAEASTSNVCDKEREKENACGNATVDRVDRVKGLRCTRIDNENLLVSVNERSSGFARAISKDVAGSGTAQQ